MVERSVHKCTARKCRHPDVIKAAAVIQHLPVESVVAAVPVGKEPEGLGDGDGGEDGGVSAAGSGAGSCEKGEDGKGDSIDEEPDGKDGDGTEVDGSGVGRDESDESSENGDVDSPHLEGKMALCETWEHIWLCQVKEVEADDSVEVQLWNCDKEGGEFGPLWTDKRGKVPYDFVMSEEEVIAQDLRGFSYVGADRPLEEGELMHLGLKLVNGRPASTDVTQLITAPPVNVSD